MSSHVIEVVFEQVLLYFFCYIQGSTSLIFCSVCFWPFCFLISDYCDLVLSLYFARYYIHSSSSYPYILNTVFMVVLLLYLYTISMAIWSLSPNLHFVFLCVISFDLYKPAQLQCLPITCSK